MTTRQWILLLICGFTIATLVGCGGGSSTTTPPVIAIAFSTAPPASLAVSATAPVAATVTGDSSNAGVDWSCTPASACGSFNPAHTASAASTTYTAPATVPTGNTVTITAKATADSTKSVSANTTITTAQPIVVTFSQAPPSSMQINSTAQVGAQATNDNSNKGVDWTCAPASNCGSFNPTHTASSALTAYTAPSSIPVGGSVTVTATSTTDNTKFISQKVTITGNSPILVVFDPQPTPFSIVSSNSSMTALVANDSQNLGVDWSCVPAGCGSFNPTHTASGQPTTYTAPSSAVTATVTAASTRNNSRFTQATVTVKASFDKTALNGNYVFAVSGRDSFAKVVPGGYQVAGVLTADGNGNITGGEQLYSDQPAVALDSILASGSSYSIGTDGRGIITLNTGDKNIGVSGVETFSVVMLNGTQGLVTQFDASAASSGTLDLQTPFSAGNPLANGYAFATNGVEAGAMRTPSPLGIGGVFNVDGAGTISGNGSVADINDNGTLTTGATVVGSVPNPDLLGKNVINLTLNSTTNLTFLGFTIDDTHVKLIERDHTFGATGGTAYAQGSSTGKFTNASFNATVVYSTEGYSTVGLSTLQPTAYAGLFTADGAGNISNGFTDLNQFGTLITDSLTGTYAADSTKTGRVTTSGMFYGASGQGPSWIFYLTGASDAPALILQVDASPLIETVGTTYTQASGLSVSAFTGSYGMGFTFSPPTGGENDGTGQATATGAAGLAGKEDLNVCNIGTTPNLCSSFTPNPGLTLSGGGFTDTSGIPGRFTGPLSDGIAFNGDPIVFYMADGTRVLFVDMGGQPALGVFRQQQ